MKKEMLINVQQPEECRIAILEDGVLEELYVERASHESYVGNIYKGRIVNIEPSIQAAFVDFGVGRNGFLHVSDVEPTYWRHLERGRNGDRGGRDRDRDRGRDRAQLPAYLQGMDLDDFEDRPAPIERTLVNELPNDFAAGVELEPAPRAKPAKEEVSEAPAPPPPGPVEEGAAAPAPPAQQAEKALLKAHPDTIPEEEGTKGRRRSRGTASRRRSRSAPTSEDAPAAETPAPSEEAKAEPEPPASEAKPRLMDSAERRTEKTTGPEASVEGSVGEGGGDFDPDLFFPPPRPRAQPEKKEAAPAPAPVAPPEPPPPPVREAPEERAAPERTRPEPPRPRAPSRGAGRFHGSIEDALEADLAEADIGHEEAGEQEAFVAPQEPKEPPEEVRRPALDEEEDLGRPAFRERRGDRGDWSERGERGDRGERGERRDRGDRGRGRGRRNERGRDGGRPGAGRPRPLIQDIFKRGQEVIVQVIKEGIGSKGPTLSTYISIPGRYLVLMPCLNRTGVSRKIEDDEQRRRLRQMFNELKPPEGLGFIMRTAAIDKNKKDVQRDLVYLCRLWQVVARRIKKTRSPAEIYQESEMVTRTIRDNFTADIATIWIDDRNAFEAAQEFMQGVMPRHADCLKYYDGKEPLFHKFGIEDEIHRIQQKKVPLPNGGSIVIEQTEALVAIDVNSGNFRADNNAEETAYQMNLLAAKEIARQLRLRDLGGVIVNDFIDMRDEKHRRAVERTLRDAMRRDRARTKILRISQFGIIEMTRQRVRPSLKRSGYMDCPYCKGAALVKTPESMAIEIMRLMQVASTKESIVRVEVTVPTEVAEYLLNRKRRELVQLEEAGQMTVSVRGVHAAPPEHLQMVCLDRNDNEVRLLGPEPVPVPYRPRR
jgi:ribonuclease E